MKKKQITKIITTVVIALIIVLVFKDGLSLSYLEDKTDDGIYTVKIVNPNEEAGVLTLAYKDGDTYIDVEGDTVEVEKGTKIKAYFKQGFNSSYEIVNWGLDYDGVLNLVQASAEENDYYKEEKLIKTIEADTTVYLYTKVKGSSVHKVSFFDSSVKDKRCLVGLDFVEDGKNASDVAVISQAKKGFDQIGWSEPLKNVKEDLELYPRYSCTVFTMFRDYHSMFMRGLLITMLLSVISVASALFFAIVLCLVRLSDNKVLSVAATLYVEIIRGVPLLLQLLLVYVLIGPTKISFGSFFTTEVISCILTLTINSSAYSSEVFRAGIQAVDKGQMEAGRALGMSKWGVYKKIVIPQGLKNSLPALVNELVQMIKETSLAVSVDASIGELMSVRKVITAATYVNLPPYIIVAMIYFCVTFSLSKGVRSLEKRLASRG